jgi:hypothetical protein
MGYDLDSRRTNYEVKYISETDNHIDGEICSKIETLVQMLSSIEYPTADVDIDGVRGDPKFPNMTTVGADEVMLNTKYIDPNGGVLPDGIWQCEENGKSILLEIDMVFDGWRDGVERESEPISENA